MSYKSIHSKDCRWSIAKEKTLNIKNPTEPWHKVYHNGIHFRKYKDNRTISIYIVINNHRLIITFPYGKPIGECAG